SRNRRPRRHKPRHQDAPGPPATRKMREVKQKTARPLRAGINPPRLHKPPSRRRKPPLRPPRMLADARLTRPSIKTANVDPPDAGRRIHRPSRRHLQLPLPLARHLQPQTQRIVMIKHSLQRQYQISLAQPRRHLQQHRLIEAIERTTALQKPAHDRRRRQSTSGNVRHRPRRLPDNAGNPGKPRNSLMLKHRTRRNHQPSPAPNAHNLDRYAAVAPKPEEVDVDPNTLQSQYLGKQSTQQLLTRTARQTRYPSTNLRRRQRAAVQLPVRRQRKTIQNNDR